MKLMRKPFILIRHGETEFNKNHLIGGKTDVPLTEKGKEQAKSAREIVAKYQYDAIITTPLLRAKETADILFPNLPKEIISDLRERDWGNFEGESQQFQPPYEETPPNGEAWQDFCERVVSALNDILNRYDSPIIIAHSGVFRVIQQLAKGTPYGARVGNVEPYYVCAGDENKAWHVMSLLELEKKIE